MEKKDHTSAYFDDHTPDYSGKRLRHAADVINRAARPNASILDVGCGTGNVLQFFQKHTGIEKFYGVDVSEESLKRAEERAHGEYFRGSILDSESVEAIGRQFDYLVMASVLHHLIGNTRKASKDNACLALRNSLSLVKKGGYLFLFEPTIYPAFVMAMAFYVKKNVSKVTDGRCDIFGVDWLNIGAPVVSYYTNEMLVDMIAGTGMGRVVDCYVEDKRVHPLARLAMIRRRTDTTFVIEKTS